MMKSLYISIIIAGIAAVGIVFVFSHPSYSQSPQISTVVIPKDSIRLSSGKNVEPQLLVVVLGVNNTVRWINEDMSANSVTANNHGDPLFWNATHSSNTMLLQGRSFNFTFTRVGDFRYHSEPHPWVHGWVLVLPQSGENLTQTVVLNDSKVPSPCKMFSTPCPNTHSFTAQKFGPDVYIEKMRIDGVDHYAIIQGPYLWVYPQTIHDNLVTEPDFIALLKMVGANITMPLK